MKSLIRLQFYHNIKKKYSLWPYAPSNVQWKTLKRELETTDKLSPVFISTSDTHLTLGWIFKPLDFCINLQYYYLKSIYSIDKSQRLINVAKSFLKINVFNKHMRILQIRWTFE